jgi:hypothetical protein
MPLSAGTRLGPYEILSTRGIDGTFSASSFNLARMLTGRNGNAAWPTRERRAARHRRLYLVAIPLAFVWLMAEYGCYIFIAVMWLLPGRGIEKTARQPGVI